MDDATVTAHAYRVTLDEEIADRLHDRRWYRARAWTVDWPTRYENEVILRALVKLARKARALSRPVAERADPVTAAKADDYWAGDHHVYESDPSTVNLEGMPEFNGAFG